MDELSSLAMEGGAPSALSDRDWPPAAASLWRLSEVVVAMLLGGDESGSESELSSLSSSGQSNSAETFVCLPLGPFTHVVCGSLCSDVNITLRVTSCTHHHSSVAAAAAVNHRGWPKKRDHFV